MVKIILALQTVTIKIYGEANTQHRTTIIKNGLHNKKMYSHLVFTEGNVLLEGKEAMVLATNAKIVDIEVENIEQKIAKLVGNRDIYLKGIDAVPEGKERELVKNLISYN
jgi:hypothetical protein